ncbi:MAG TPA: hypothetical protein VIT20_02595 [Propionibacteriaceae bacterium]
MAQAQKAPKPPQDPYAQRGKTLTSAVQRLRGWVGSDPSKEPELADALVELTAHRLLGHAYAAAAADAQDSVRRAAQLLTADGPIGPYTAPADTARYLAALVQLAAVQAGLGLPDAAARMLESLQETRADLAGRELEEPIEAQTAVWALWSGGRVAVARGDAARANAYADATLARVAEAGLRTEVEAAYAVIDADRLASDARWAAGMPDDALAFLHTAKDGYDRVVDGRLQTPTRLSPVLLERLAEPGFGLYRDLADRLAARGETELGLVTRRTLVDTLRGLTARLGEPAQVQLASTLTDLAEDLRAVGRTDEAAAATQEALSVRPAGVEPRTRAALGSSRIRWDQLAGREAYATTTTASPVTTDQDAQRARDTATWLEAERREAHRVESQRLEAARAEAESREADRVRAEQAAAEQRAAESEAAARAAALDAERKAAAEEAERLETKRRREERLEQHRLEVEQREAERVAQDPFETARLEYERESEPEVIEPLVVPVEPTSEPTPEPEPEPEPTPEPEPEQTPEPEPDELVTAQQTWSDARARGDRKAARGALEHVVEILRPRAEADLPTYGAQLQAALEDLSSARLRSGDIWGSRAPAKEAKELARSLGR